MKKALFTLAIVLLAVVAQAQESPVLQRPDPLPYWVDTITAQPDGYVMDADGNVEISNSDGLVWLISAVNGLNGCEPASRPSFR